MLARVHRARTLLLALVTACTSQSKPSLPPSFSATLHYSTGQSGLLFMDEPGQRARWLSFSMSAPPDAREIRGMTLLRSGLRCDWWEDPLRTVVQDCICESWPSFFQRSVPIFPWPSLPEASLNASGVACPAIFSNSSSPSQCDRWYVPLGNLTFYYLYTPSNSWQGEGSWLGDAVFSTRHFDVLVTDWQLEVDDSMFDFPMQCKTELFASRMTQQGRTDADTPGTFTVADPSRCTPKDARSGTNVYHCFATKHFTVHSTTTCAENGGCGLIVDTHGWAMDADMEDANTNMRAMASKHGYVILQGTAGPGLPPNTSWDAKPGGYMESAHQILEVVAELISAFRLDPSRLHACGFSQGAVMTWGLYCEAPQLWASIAPVAAASPCFGPWSSSKSVPEPIPTLYQHGRHDALVPFASGEETVLALAKGWNITVEATVVDAGTKFNHSRVRGKGRALVETIWHDYVNFPEGTDPINNWGHCFVGSADVPGRTWLFGQVRHFGCPPTGSAQFVAFEKVMQFFLANPKPRSTSERVARLSKKMGLSGNAGAGEVFV